MLYNYYLMDDGGANSIEMPIVLNVGTQLEHEYGLYKVIQIRQPEASDEVLVFICDRIDKSQHLTDQIKSGKSFTYGKQN